MKPPPIFAFILLTCSFDNNFEVTNYAMWALECNLRSTEEQNNSPCPAAHHPEAIYIPFFTASARAFAFEFQHEVMLVVATLVDLKSTRQQRTSCPFPWSHWGVYPALRLFALNNAFQDVMLFGVDTCGDLKLINREKTSVFPPASPWNHLQFLHLYY